MFLQETSDADPPGYPSQTFPRPSSPDLARLIIELMSTATRQRATNPTVRRARPSDASALVNLQAEIYAEGRWFVGDGPPSAQTLERRLRAFGDEMTLYLVALPPKGEVCAWLELHRLTPKRLRHVAMLTLAVSSDWRQRGVATKLLENAYRWAAQNDVRKVQLNVRANNGAALALYRSQGFEQEGCERSQILEGERYEDNILMAKFL